MVFKSLTVKIALKRSVYSVVLVEASVWNRFHTEALYYTFYIFTFCICKGIIDIMVYATLCPCSFFFSVIDTRYEWPRRARNMSEVNCKQLGVTPLQSVFVSLIAKMT